MSTQQTIADFSTWMGLTEVYVVVIFSDIIRKTGQQCQTILWFSGENSPKVHGLALAPPLWTMWIAINLVSWECVHNIQKQSMYEYHLIKFSILI